MTNVHTRRKLLLGLAGAIALGPTLVHARPPRLVVEARDRYVRRRVVPHVVDTLTRRLAGTPTAGDTTIDVMIKTVLFPEDSADFEQDDRRFMRPPVIDQIDTDVTVREASGRARRFPLFVTTPASPFGRFPGSEVDDGRIWRLADMYAYWLVQKL